MNWLDCSEPGGYPAYFQLRLAALNPNDSAEFCSLSERIANGCDGGLQG